MPYDAPGRAWSARLALFLALILPVLVPAGASGDSWFKADTHVHSVVSGDGLPDLGIISSAGKARGYNAMFITDHQAGSNFPISTVIANHVVFDDDLGSKWDPDFFGSPTIHLAELASTPVRSGTASLHVKAAATTSGEGFVRLKRGPNLRSGDLILRFSAFPTRIDAGSGMYTSVSIGGDASEGTLEGYTTAGGAISPGKTNVLVWQLGNARTASSDPNKRVIVNDLPYTLNQWNDYEIDITTGAIKRNGVAVAGGKGLGAIPAADQPSTVNALTIMKMAAAASGGGMAEGYFDAYNLDASAPVPSGQEFLARNNGLHAYDTADFRLYPSIEMGFNRHAQRFNFDIGSAAEYNAFFQCDPVGEHCGITRGIDGILPTQQTGYLAQLNHPNLPGGVKESELIANDYNAFGADVMEVREDSGGVPPSTMIDIWDRTLQRGHVVIGTWSSDMHKIESLDVPDRGVTTYIRSPSLDFNDLMRSLYEGRAYLGRRAFAGRIAFNLDPASQEPYPARYPVQVPESQASANVHLAITGGIPAGARVVWISNGGPIATDAPAGSTYEATKPVALGGAMTYVRAELRDASGARIAMTEPIFFSDVAGLPAGMRFSVDGVTTASGRDYTRIAAKAITTSTWNTAGESLAVTLSDPPGTLARLTMDTGTRVPSRVHVDGANIAAASSPAAFDAATGSAWLYDAAAHRLRMKVLHAASLAQMDIDFSTTADTEAPAAPATLTATAAGPSRADLAWAAASDNRGVASYQVRRGACGQGSVLATVGGGVTAFSDTSVTPGATVSYEVVAVDAAGNVSPPSPCATVTLPTSDTKTFAPAADAYVQADTPTTKFGSAAKLRADASPDVRSYVRFDLSGLQGTVTRATLVFTAASASNSGFDVRRVADTTWDERLIDYSSAPPVATGLPLGSSLPFALGGTPSLDVTAAVAGNGPVGFALTTGSATAFSLASREAGAGAPRLIVETGASSTPPPPPPPPPATTTLTPAADAYVAADTPTTQFGTATKLRADASPDVRSYVRFNVPALSGAVTRATLVFTSTSASSTGFDVRSVADTTWGEGTINYANAPATGASLRSSGSFATGATVSVDVTAAVSGNGPVGFALTTPNTTALSLASREVGATGPRLVVETSG